MAKLEGNEIYPFYFGASPETLRLAGELRKSMTKTEMILWQSIRNRQLDGYRFRRQHPVKDFILDFFCYEVMLGIEVDGCVHQDSYQADRDRERTKILNRLGIEILRFTNDQIDSDLKNVVSLIRKAINELKTNRKK